LFRRAASVAKIRPHQGGFCGCKRTLFRQAQAARGAVAVGDCLHHSLDLQASENAAFPDRRRSPDATCVHARKPGRFPRNRGLHSWPRAKGLLRLHGWRESA